MDDPYADPVLYDLEYADYREDLDWYVRVASAGRGPVLELGCGNGRVTLPIARAGIPVVGVDRSLPMILDLQRKLTRESVSVRDRVNVHYGEFTAWAPSRLFPVAIVPFNALHHLHSPEALKSLFEKLKTWVAPGGVLAFDVYLPDRELMARDPSSRYEARDFIDPRDGTRLASWEQGWWEPERRIHHVVYTYVDPSGLARRAHLELFMLELEEWRRILRDSGWRILDEAQDFRGEPIRATSLKWVVRATAA